MIALVLLLAVPDLSGMLKLTNEQSLAHACPIAMDKAITNKHVLTTGQMVWGVLDGEQFHGLVESGSADEFRDLSYIHPITEARFPKWYQISQSAPKIGDRIYFIGFDWSSKKVAFGPETFSAKVTQVMNGNIAFDPAGKPGSSGSCILNEAGEVVAINKGAKETDDSKGEVGFGVGIWGNWLQLKADEPEKEEEASPCWFNFSATQ